MTNGRGLPRLMVSVALALAMCLAVTVNAAAASPALAGPVPTQTGSSADLYFTDKETVYSNQAEGHWRYTGPALYVDIRRVRIKKKDITYFVADIRTLDPKAITSGTVKGLAVPETLSRKFGAVYAQNGDFFTVEQSLKGIMIRSGKVLSQRKGADTMAFLPNGEMRTFTPGETTAKKLLAVGVRDAWSFGPTLIRNGVVITNFSRARNRGRNPRSGFGMVEPGHYVGIVVGGRNKGYSVGMTYPEFAGLFKQYGCIQAYCFDGGASASMVFMGKAMEVRVKTSAGKLTKRRVPDIFIIGKSSLVPKK